MEEAQIVTTELGSSIPCQETPGATREFFLRPPDWRYQLVAEYLDKEEEGKSSPMPAEALLQYAVRGLRAYRDPNTRYMLSVSWRPFHDAVVLGTIRKRSAITADMENYLIHGITAKQLSDNGWYIQPEVYEMYRLLFFDLSGIQAIHAWFNDFLFEPERYSSDSTLLRARLMAYHGTVQDAQEALMPMSDSDSSKLMKKIANNERMKTVFDYLVKKVSIDKQTYATLMEAAVKSMTDRDFQEHMKDRDMEGSKSLDELAENIEQGIRAYSQTEIEAVNSLGLDFTNQYTAEAIRRKDN